MKNITLVFVVFLTMLIHSFGQTKKANPYQLNIVADMEDYRKLCILDTGNRLIDLEQAIPGLKLDIRYATSNNFTHKPVYTSAHAFMRKPAADALRQVQAELVSRGMALQVFDAYRPYAATLLFWDLVKDTLFVASPASGSRHNRGCAVDVTLINLKTGMELEMPTSYDAFTRAAGAFYDSITPTARMNRGLLIEIMSKYGFRVMDSEWWHFDYQGWDRYQLMDLSFEELLAPRAAGTPSGW
ncbi:MAG TPA: M15 family metallopeptidase [Bacteroidales bacterium]|nr:M15 family metallopeptidase [Bacteroidales bacterium]HPS51537.1 M15 family metallopeptidase [Bacteroidales bacterium]